MSAVKDEQTPGRHLKPSDFSLSDALIFYFLRNYDVPNMHIVIVIQYFMGEIAERFLQQHWDSTSLDPMFENRYRAIIEESFKIKVNADPDPEDPGLEAKTLDVVEELDRVMQDEEFRDRFSRVRAAGSGKDWTNYDIIQKLWNDNKDVLEFVPAKLCFESTLKNRTRGRSYDLAPAEGRLVFVKALEGFGGKPVGSRQFP